MPTNRSELQRALGRLSSAARNGARAKRRLATKLASMTPAQLRRVAPETFMRLGPDGLREFAVKTKCLNLHGVAEAPSPPLAKVEPLLTRLHRKWHFAHPLLKCVAAMALCGFAGVGVAHFSELAADSYGVRNAGAIGGWPKCVRLDRGDDDCVYQTSSGTLTIDRIVAMTGLPLDTLIAWNADRDFRYALPEGAYLVVPRRSGRR